jgi:hypothetical protein
MWEGGFDPKLLYTGLGALLIDHAGLVDHAGERVL